MTYRPVPGPEGHLLIGSMLEFARNPAEFLLYTSIEYGDIVQFSVLGRRYYLLVRPEYVQEVLVTQSDKFRKSRQDVDILGKFLGRGILLTEGDYHRRQRKLVQPAFHTTRIQAYADMMVATTRWMMAQWVDGSAQPVDLLMRQLTMEVIAKSLFDVDMSDQAGVLGEAIETLQHVAGIDFLVQNTIPDWLPLERNRRRAAARAVLDSVIRQTINERRAANEDKGDLLSMLLLSEDETGTRMTDDEVRDEAVTLFSAGHETTSNALAWIWYLLSQHPDIEARLHHEVDTVLDGRTATFSDLPDLQYTTKVIKEALRLYPPAWTLNGREALEDVVIDDYLIPKGCNVFISPYAVQRHPGYFEDPRRFDPERFSPEREKRIPRYAYFPFGGGPRVCIGNSFAMMEMQLIVATMAQQISLSLMPDQVVAADMMVTMGPKYGLRMRVKTRQPVKLQAAYEF